MIEVLLESFISGSMVVVSMNMVLMFICIMCMKFFLEICCIGECGLRIEVLCSRLLMWLNLFFRVVVSFLNWCGWVVFRLNGIMVVCGWLVVSMVL